MIGVHTPDDPVFLGTVTTQGVDGTLINKYIGIFATKGAARAAVNRYVKTLANGNRKLVSMGVRRGVVQWGDSQ